MLKTLIAASVAMLTIAMSGPSAHIQAQASPPISAVEAPPIAHWGSPGAFIIAFGMPAEVDAFCRSGAPVPPGYVVLACTRDDRRQVVMPNPCLYQHEYYARLMCHEQAHLSRPGVPGWKH